MSEVATASNQLTTPIRLRMISVHLDLSPVARPTRTSLLTNRSCQLTVARFGDLANRPRPGPGTSRYGQG